MGLAKKNTDLQNEKTSVNPAANTKRKSTQVQSPNTTAVSAHGNTTDGLSQGKNPGKNVRIRNNPQYSSGPRQRPGCPHPNPAPRP